MNREEVLEIVRGCSSPVAAINTLIAKRRCHAILEAAKIIDKLNMTSAMTGNGEKTMVEQRRCIIVRKLKRELFLALYSTCTMWMNLVL